MSVLARFVLFTIYGVALFAAFKIWENVATATYVQSTVIYSALIMMAFVVLFVEHWFTRPTDVLASSISVLLLLVPLKNELTEMGGWYTGLIVYCSVVASIACLALIFYDTAKSPSWWGNNVSKLCKQIAAKFGNGKLVYSLLFISSLFFYVDLQSTYFLVLFSFSAFVILIDPSKIKFSLVIDSKNSSAIGEVFGVQSKNTFLAKLYSDRPALKRFDFVSFKYSMDDNQQTRSGLIIDNYLLNKEQWIKVLSSKDISEVVGNLDKGFSYDTDVIYKITPSEPDKYLNRFIGVVTEKSNISGIKFEYVSNIPISEGSLLEINYRGSRVLYQVVDGKTAVESLEHKDETGKVYGHSVQVGQWDEDEICFDKYGWVPPINTPVYLASDIEEVDTPIHNYLLGTVPDTNYPVFLNLDEAVSHHTAILGVTGTGKSVFARDVIRKVLSEGRKVVCVDFTQEYANKFADLNISSVASEDDQNKIFDAVNTLELQAAEFANNRDHRLIESKQAEIEGILRASFQSFFEGDDSIAVFDLPDVKNTSAVLEYTKWFFKVLFDIAKEEHCFDNKVCIVLEEAHTIVPEWNFKGVAEKSADAVINSICQIALQGRKYDIGFIVIGQRSANISKTVLTQCNTIIAFQQFDKTSAEFLSNHLGAEMVTSLPRLKKRQAIAIGKAIRTSLPIIFEVPTITEPE